MLISSTYGKSNVKFLKVHRIDETKHNIIEANVEVLLRGSFDIAYTKGDNTPIVPTDTVKNTILVLAQKENTWPIERFAATLVNHFVNKYEQVGGVEVKIVENSWSRIGDHPHSFQHEGPETRRTVLDYEKASGKLQLASSINGLTLLKSTGSMFYGYNVCDFTTLKPTYDRILSTDVDVSWRYDPDMISTLGLIEKYADSGLFDDAYTKARNTTLDIFCEEKSASVQATMYNMSQKILQLVKEVADVSYELPNKHYILYDLKWKGIDNDVLFYPSPDPNGLIKCTVGRN
ncbi:uncharacterized protein SPAPADRAFT_136352 [Spathaspora passalidarum NRRL Y-27907]|uniref:Uricase n=1 Tax=Spathaspora passalidarum (strain NRRL Y-27907 / 11-Y1) TaxID=619300 RepID=G3AKA9_SPAPN|nr:uncharacterized protein SPAPADRAFT_136352 [Spathaspora passalidarum NRRL Y-27907]EGW33568.1 hypothetical protein SPAPADRAFT_136352 [Spathaspora passalidarum NRRL Y-27907]